MGVKMTNLLGLWPAARRALIVAALSLTTLLWSGSDQAWSVECANGGDGANRAGEDGGHAANTACGENADASGIEGANTALGNGANAIGNFSNNTATGNGADASGNTSNNTATGNGADASGNQQQHGAGIAAPRR